MKHIVFDCDGTLVDTSGTRNQLFPGIKDFLEAHRKDCLYYVWTARGRTSTVRILEELGIRFYFEDISTPDDAIPKPHIAGLVDLLGRTAKSAICVIGDSGNDMLGAKNFGVLAIGAMWNKDTRESYLKGAGADFIVSDPVECSKLIELNLIGAPNV